jgi:hypothetical protein
MVLIGDLDLGTHAAKLAQPLQAIFEDRLRDVAQAGGLGQQYAGGRLQVRGQARVGLSLDIAAPERLEVGGRRG